MKELWKTSIEALKEKISNENYKTWIASIDFRGTDKTHLTLAVPNQFFADWIDSHYMGLIREALGKSPELREKKIRWEFDERLLNQIKEQEESCYTKKNTLREEDAFSQSSAKQTSKKQAQASVGLSPDLTFDNFVVGPSNQLAHAASLAVGSKPGNKYNPLFIYGGVGLGKTHLANAMGLHIKEQHPKARMVFVSAEEFTNQFIWSLKTHCIDDFRNKYRKQCDVLLIDDIQFLAGRTQTQNEFFHTFNALYHSNAQIVVTCDVDPKKVRSMEQRLVSRFQSGLVVDVQEPELDTRTAILFHKAEKEKIALSREVAMYIAEHVESNVRELEGLLLQLTVRAELLGCPLNLALAKQVLSNEQHKPVQNISVEQVQKTVCGYFNVGLTELKSKSRVRTISFPRMIAMYLCRQKLGVSYLDIGNRFGGKDHTTVMNAVKKISGMLEADSKISKMISEIEKDLGRKTLSPHSTKTSEVA